MSKLDWQAVEYFGAIWGILIVLITFVWALNRYIARQDAAREARRHIFGPRDEPPSGAAGW